MLRSVSEDWGAHTEPRVAIERLDADPRRERVDVDALRRRFRSFAMVVEAMVMSGINRVAQLRADGVVNRLTTVDYSANGGLDDQWYQEGCFDLGDGTGEDGDVLVVEARLPAGLRAFSLSLTDPCFSTIDWANAQSSLNRRQAVVDPDAILRLVVAASDPGVQNWLDTTGHRAGVLQFRWSGGAVCPEVSVRVVASGALDRVLPTTVARVTPEQRAAAVRCPAGRRAAAHVLVVRARGVQDRSHASSQRGNSASDERIVVAPASRSSPAAWGPVVTATMCAPARAAARTSLGVSPT